MHKKSPVKSSKKVSAKPKARLKAKACRVGGGNSGYKVPNDTGH